MNPETALSISEIFFSLQGEGSHTGWPTVFIRTAGCNLRCLYCDTAYAQEEGAEKTLPEVLTAVAAYPCKRVCITGGEPLLQRAAVLELARTLEARGYLLSLETNGSFPVGGLPAGLQAVIDVKTPGSGMSGVNNYENLRAARRGFDEFKFVIAEAEDIPWSLALIRKHRLDRRYRCHLGYVSGKIDPARIAAAIIESGLDLRLNMQLHKIIWPHEPRGR